MVTDIKETLDILFLENTLGSWLIFTLCILVGIMGRKYTSKFVSHIIFLLFKKSAHAVGVEVFDEKVKKPLRYFTVIGGVFFGSLFIQFPEEWDYLKVFFRDLYYIALVYGIIWLGMKMTEYLGEIFKHKSEETDSKLDDQLVPFVVDLLKVLVVIAGILIILSNIFDVNIGTLVAGIGIGGLALAMASKDSIENLLGSFTIFSDQPFKIGDTIELNGTIGTVEKVGFRSTRLRTPDKTLVTIPNRNIITSLLNNYSERTYRRTRFTVGLVYETTPAQIKKIKKELIDFLSKEDRISKEHDIQVRLSEFGDSSINILVQYFGASVDYNEDFSLKEHVNFKIMEIISKNKSDFAFPSQTIYVKQ